MRLASRAFFVKCLLGVLTLILLLTVNVVLARSASSKTFAKLSDRVKMSQQRLAALRAIMASQPTPLAAYIVPTADAHNSEYIAPVDGRRSWLSGFTGSAGTAVVTSARALLWTDGRYYTQVQRETDPDVWTLMKQSLPDTPTMEKWLSTNLPEGATVGVDPFLMSRETWTPLQTALTKAKIQLLAVPKNLVDEARTQVNDPAPDTALSKAKMQLLAVPKNLVDEARTQVNDPAPDTALTKAKMQLLAVPKNLVDEARTQVNDPAPSRPTNPIIPLPLKYTGKPAGEKIKELRGKIVEKKAAALVITALDEVAYTLNLRGSDIEYNPVFFSYLVITPTSVVLFWDDGLLPRDVAQHLEGEGVTVEGRRYEEIVPYLQQLAVSQTGDGNRSLWLSSEASEAIHIAAGGRDVLEVPLDLISEVSPVALMKLIKNEVELEGFRQCHIRDGIAVVRFFNWLHQQLSSGAAITEIQAADKLLEFRKDEDLFMGPSFETIPGAGPNGAIIHYAPSRDGVQTVIQPREMFLLDSGGQYMDGTTDITRTRHMSGTPTPEQRDAFTRVLKGQMMVGSALFPKGVKGNVLDSFARKALWDVGLDYAHGTGHGVGHFLNVHEGPSGVSWRPYPHDPGLKPGQVLSNEPGYYKVGEYGIRHEDLVITVAVTNQSHHPRAKNLVGNYDGRGVLGFETITLVPNQRECIDVSLLDDFELSYLNAYHNRVFATLGPILEARGLTDDLQWLDKECKPIYRE